MVSPVKSLAKKLISNWKEKMNHKILWKDAQDMLYEEPIFKEDTNLQNMDKEDALGTFDSFKRLEIVFEIPSEDGRRIALAV